MIETVEIFVRSVSDQMKRSSNEKDLIQLNDPSYESPRYFAHSLKDDMNEPGRNEVTTYAPSDDFEPPPQNQTEFKVAQILWQVCPVILFLFGTAGNILILLMLRSLRLGRTSMHLYLRALAISDLCVLYTGLLRQWLSWTFGIDFRDQHVFLCKVHLWMVYVSLYVSAWLLVLMTLERTCSACWPHRVNTFCTKKRACFLIILVVVLLSCLQSHFLFGMTLTHKDNLTDSSAVDAQRKITCSPISEDYGYFIDDILPLIDIILLSLLPFVCVIVGNFIIVWKTFLSLRTAAELNLTSGNSTLLRRRRASSMTIILLCLSTLFLLTTSPTCVFNIWERGNNPFEIQKSPHRMARVELMWAIVNLLMYCNNTFNFYLYCLSGRKFRNEMRRQFSRRRTDSQSVVLSAPSVQLHRFTFNGQSIANGRENGHAGSPHQGTQYGRSSNAYL